MGPGRVRRIIRPFGRAAPEGSLRSESGGVGMSSPPATRSRWMDWKPKARTLAESADTEPTKTSETDSVVFVGSTSGESPEIEAGADPAELGGAAGVVKRGGGAVIARD